jgi:hypothetical protein
MYKKIMKILLLMVIIGSTTSVYAGTGHFELNSTVGETHIIEKLPLDFGNKGYGSCFSDRVDAFEKSGLFSEKTSINKHKEKIYGKYEFTANKAGSITVKIDHPEWLHPDYYTFNVKNK